MPDKFTPKLRIGDLNDYIAPSQACIVSLKGIKSKSKPNSDSSQTQVQGKVVPAVEPLSNETVKIDLKECLACSGCVTSAETILMEKQSVDEFVSNIGQGRPVIVSISPQSRASLAEHFGLSPLQVLRKLTTFFKSMGVKAVFDTSCSRDLSLIEACYEFISRYKQSKLRHDDQSEACTPMISSSCPGWICFAEKQHGSYILPYVSSVKSPQQTMGSIIKHHICHKMGLRPDETYHVTVMPCYDKKLEASRDDFVVEMEYEDENHMKSTVMVTEVDSVLTSGEVLKLMQSKSVDFSTLEESPLDKLLTNVTDDGHLYGVNGSSGGYAETIFRYAAKELFGREIKGPLEFRNVKEKNSDFRQACLEIDGEVVLKFALCYGNRNLQNVVRNIKSGKSDFHFLEIMACPSGCLNGGGQIEKKPGQSGKDLIQSLESVYRNEVVVVDPFDNSTVKGLYEEWLEQPGSEMATKYMHTKYHQVEKSLDTDTLRSLDHRNYIRVTLNFRPFNHLTYK